MRYAGRPGWLVSHGGGSEFVLALHVCAALGLEHALAPDVPPLDRPLPVGSVLPVAELDLGRIAADWEDWWAGLLSRGHRRPEFRPGLRDGLPAGLDTRGDELRAASARWTVERKRALERAGAPHPREVLPVQRAVAELEAEGFASPLFELHVEELPVAGDLWRHEPRGFVLASTRALRADTAAERLKTALRDLLV
ncbi:hypothetical protein [Actinosynnema mirum]|uniref:Uncharacterized protein n=1 Tax=Actinosynnema mirum (strain ATCC 29888 / DSM 43827 / JCM 3225 / NBRC 14064 / NCIMB 13271 / NRRL B-12336 / IMRU 3971 / 101) TaxID=446462 RepID=C6WGC0_ACTMD|nr:hypothetical protein [Actinosynnema mirum]ACU39884.1 hypothetical protein Amir_6077 [Actinosynnema mirum DSM 43827]